MRVEGIEPPHHRYLLLRQARLPIPPYSHTTKLWGDGWGSNPRRPESQSGALPTELPPPLFGDLGGNRTPNKQSRNLWLYPIELRGQNLVGEVGFAPTQPVAFDLQSNPALSLRRSPLIKLFYNTIYSMSTYLEHRARFELAVLEFCRLLRWATPPPVHNQLFVVRLAQL